MTSAPAPGVQRLKHVVVVMMEGRSFDHMLGGLKATEPRIDGLTGQETNPDSTGAKVRVEPLARFQGQLDPQPGHSFQDVDFQIFDDDTSPTRLATMSGFVKSYYTQRRDASHARQVMHYFAPEKLPVLTTLATEFAVFNHWFASIPGPSLCNHAFAHYGTSFGHVGMEPFYAKVPYKSIHERLIGAGHTAKIYQFDRSSSLLEVANLLQQPRQVFGTYAQLLTDCAAGRLADYSFVVPNYVDHDSDDGVVMASDQHPDHHVQEGERFIASVYTAIRDNPTLWETTALLVVYSQHGGTYDHVPPPACTPDGFVAAPAATRTARPFQFDRLGVRVPAILISPWIPKGTVVHRVFEHASIPATLTGLWLGDYADRSPRETAANTFLELLSLSLPRIDGPLFTDSSDPESVRQRRIQSVGSTSTPEGPVERSVPPPSGVRRSRRRPTVQVFLSYSRSDLQAVRLFYARLRAERGIKPWMDEKDLIPGQEWEREITKAVQASHCVLACLSKNANDRAGYVRKEIKFALDIVDQLPAGTIYLIPVKLEECDLPDRIRRFQWVNLFDHEGYENLMRALRARANSLAESVD